MRHFQMDARDGGSNTNACKPCCCESFTMAPGERDMLFLDYSSWVVPLGFLIGKPTVVVTANTEACSNSPIDGQLPPSGDRFYAQTPPGTPLDIDLSVSARPAGADLTYSIIELSGPSRGTVDIDKDSGRLIYEPLAGYTGHDYFWYQIEDAYGRTSSHPVNVEVGNAAVPYDPLEMSEIPYLDGVKAGVTSSTVRIPVSMPYACSDCAVYRATISMQARDCDGNIFRHNSCFDIRCGAC